MTNNKRETYQDLEPGYGGKEFKIKIDKDWISNVNYFYTHKTFNIEIQVPLEYADKFEKQIEEILEQYKTKEDVKKR